MAARGAAHAQSTPSRGAWCGMTRTPKTNGGTGTGIAPGADATVGDTTTLVFTYQYEVKPNVGIEWVLGIPPKVKARATGSVAFLGPVLTARNVAQRGAHGVCHLPLRPGRRPAAPMPASA